MATPFALDDRMSGLIGHFYDAAADASLWTGMAADIAATLDSTSAVLKLHDADDEVRLLECTGNLHVADRDQSWASDWHRQDLWVERSARFGVSRVVTDHDLVSPGEQRSSGFYCEWLKALDIHHMVGAVFPGGAGALGVLGVHRPRSAPAYQDSDRRKVDILLPHLQRALWLSQQLALAATRQAVAEAALARIDAAVFAVDAHCRIVIRNDHGESLPNADHCLTVRQGRLTLLDELLDQQLVQAVRCSIQIASGRVAPPASALTVPRSGRLPLTLLVAPLFPSGFSTGFPVQVQPLALVIVRDPEAASLALDCLRELFGFTPTEAAVAAGLARGLSLDDVAEQRGIGATTVRAHLKRILAKTGTHRQAEAVALIARSVASLDPRA